MADKNGKENPPVGDRPPADFTNMQTAGNPPPLDIAAAESLVIRLSRGEDAPPPPHSSREGEYRS